MKRAGAGHARARKVTTDTGAQITVINVAELHTLGIKLDSIFSVAMNLNTVTAASVDLVGGVFLKFSVSNISTGEVRTTRQLCYVSKSVPGIYMSEEACIALGCIPSSFPAAGDCDSPVNKVAAAVAATENSTSAPTIPTCTNTGVVGPHDLPCKCPRRSLPPSDKPVLPCEPTVENLPRIKQYILDRFGSSAFNIC